MFKDISELDIRFDKLHGKIAAKTIKLPIAIAEKQQKIMDDSISQMDTNVAETIERGCKKMFERIQDQLDELLLKKPKKCSIQSGMFSRKYKLLIRF